MLYNVLKNWVRLSLRLFYWKYEVVGQALIPKNEAVIFAANHQNALLDALNIVCFSGRPPYFATRADLFKKDWVRSVLFSLQMYPIYRLRDGRDSIQQNKKAFGFFTQKLIDKKTVGIFPEGQGAYQYHLLPLKKGTARLAFQVLEQQPNEKLYIMPTGIHYEGRNDCLSDMLLQFHTPILVNDYWALYQENKAKAIIQLTLDIHTAIQEVLLHIEETEEEVYRAIDEKRAAVFQSTSGSLQQKFLAAKKAIADKTSPSATHTPQKKPHFFAYVLLFLTFPLWIFYFLIRRGIDQFTHQKIADTQFHASIKFVLGWLVFSFLYVILAVLTIVFFPIYYVMLLLVILLLTSAVGRWAYRFLRIKK